jgi:hypothetical protein
LSAQSRRIVFVLRLSAQAPVAAVLEHAVEPRPAFLALGRLARQRLDRAPQLGLGVLAVDPAVLRAVGGRLRQLRGGRSSRHSEQREHEDEGSQKPVHGELQRTRCASVA